MRIVGKVGNDELLRREKTAFVCSRKTPEGLEYLVGKWMLGLSAERDCMMCGNESPMERAVFTTFLQRRLPVVLVLAQAMPAAFSGEEEKALREGRLLVITHCDASVHCVTARSAFDRNVLMLSLAQHIVVGCCTKGGRLERALAGFDNVEYLDNGQPWLKTQPEAQPQPVLATPKTAERRTRLGDWSRALKLVRGHIFLDFNDSGAETYFKITKSVKASDGNYARQTMFFDHKELVGLRRAVGLISENLAQGRGVPSDLVVESLSGDVTFGVEGDAKTGQLTMTQTKSLFGGGERRRCVSLSLAELPVLVSGLDEALSVWKQ